MSPLHLHLFYFLLLSLLGFLLLAALPMKHPSAPSPSRFDLFFMSVSASTVSSMTSVELESFSNPQLLVLTLLMLAGGEVFTSMLALLARILTPHIHTRKQHHQHHQQELELGTLVEQGTMPKFIEPTEAKYSRALRWLLYLVLGYLILVHAVGSIVLLAYLRQFAGPRALLEGRRIPAGTFAAFTAVSSLANCGFVPTNENMEAFRACSGMLLAVAALVLLGNTMYPIGLRSLAWASKRVTRRSEFDFILSHADELGYGGHLTAGWRDAGMLGVTVCALAAMQAAMFGCLEWGSDGLEGMNAYQKAVGSVFMAVNSRHAGESIVDLSAVAPAILVLYVVMMYLPPYTTFFPTMGGEDGEEEKKSFVFSRLSYLTVAVLVVCITERRDLSEDPLNFNVLNIVFEVISAYGNVGFSTGYSCKRRLKQDGECMDSWVGFSGRWSKKGKLTLMVVMVLGRLKGFDMQGGKAWMIRLHLPKYLSYK